MKPCQGSLFNIGEQEVEQFTWVNDVKILVIPKPSCSVDNRSCR